MAKQRCVICRQWFEPYPPMRGRQLACSHKECRRQLERISERSWLQGRSAAWRNRRNRRVAKWARGFPHYWRWRLKNNPDYVARDNKRRARALRRQRWGCSAKPAL